MKRKRIISTLVVTCLVAIGWYGITGYMQGRTDFYVLTQGERPAHTKRRGVLSDGGTVVYEGRGYIVYELHRTLRIAGHDQSGTGISWGSKDRVVVSLAVLRARP
jgi:hypothetical protein